MAAGHLDLGYSFWLNFVCLAPSISVYFKSGSWNQSQERHLFLLTVSGKGSPKGGGGCDILPHITGHDTQHTVQERTRGCCGFCPSGPSAAGNGWKLSVSGLSELFCFPCTDFVTKYYQCLLHRLSRAEVLFFVISVLGT